MRICKRAHARERLGCAEISPDIFSQFRIEQEKGERKIQQQKNVHNMNRSICQCKISNGAPQPTQHHTPCDSGGRFMHGACTTVQSTYNSEPPGSGGSTRVVFVFENPELERMCRSFWQTHTLYVVYIWVVHVQIICNVNLVSKAIHYGTHRWNTHESIMECDTLQTTSGREPAVHQMCERIRNDCHHKIMLQRVGAMCEARRCRVVQQYYEHIYS